jgi:hypothetical protein
VSERWRNELRKLRGVEPPDDLRARVDRAPIDEPPPANRQRVIAGVVAFALFAASGAFACSNADARTGQALRHGVTFIAEAHGPRTGFSIRMEVDRVEVQGQSSGFTTAVTNNDGTGSTSIGDAAAPEFRPADFVAIPPGVPLLVLGNAAELKAYVSAGANPFTGSHRVFLSNDALPDLPLGRHVLLISATWEFGPTKKFDHATTGAGMFFPIEVVPAGTNTSAPESSALRIDCSADPVVATTVVAAATVGVRVRFADQASEREFDLTWTSPDGQPVDEHGPIPGNGVLDLPIPPGPVSVRCAGGDSTKVSIVDPHGLWTSPAVACQDTHQIEAIGPLTLTSPDREISIRRLLTLRETDKVRSPNYPGTLVVSMLPAHAMVVRDGWVVAALEIWADRIDGTVCTAAGIEPRH